jgi:hypothetical protein
MAATMTAPDLHGRLADARTEAEKVRGDLSKAENALAAAVERGDYPAAEEAKQRVEALRPHMALADASVRALTDALAALDAQRQQEQAAAQRQAREEAAQRAYNEAVAAEREAEEAANRHMAEALAGLEAVRVSLQAAKQAEQAGGNARRAAVQAQAELTGGTPPPTVITPAWASARIDRSQVLVAILRGRDL